jgi:hypothetical protein
VTFHPRALLVTAALILLLWLATEMRWLVAVAAATVVLDILSFAGVVALTQRQNYR